MMVRTASSGDMSRGLQKRIIVVVIPNSDRNRKLKLKKKIWHLVLPSIPSFSMTTPKILKDSLLRHTRHITTKCQGQAAQLIMVIMKYSGTLSTDHLNQETTWLLRGSAGDYNASSRLISSH